MHRKNFLFIMCGLVLTGVGCEQLPGTAKQQGVAIGGIGGAVAGAAVGGEHHRLLGAVLGGAAGAAGGYVIGANSDHINSRDSSGAEKASQQAQIQPVTATQAKEAKNADLNGDGFVTLDEVVALHNSGATDQEMLSKLQATDQVFELNGEQQEYLRAHGVSEQVIKQMPGINRDLRERLASQPADNSTSNNVPGK